MTAPHTRTARPYPYRVCFVCTGNICRSPMAEAVFRARVAEAGLAEHVEVDSAGTGDWHVGDDADPRTARALADAGYPLEHTARQFAVEWFDRLDLVVALDDGHLRQLRAMAPTVEAAEKVRLLRSYDDETAAADAVDADDLSVPDPYYGGAHGFDTSLRLVEAAMPGLLAAVEEAVDGTDNEATGATGATGDSSP